MSYLLNDSLLVITSPHSGRAANESACPTGEDAFETVIITLTLPLWTFVTLYLLLLLIHCLRRIQHFNLYDRCSTKNAYFRYDFHVVAGKYSANFSTFESHLIVDLLDNQLISAMTIQVPGSTMFGDNQVFMYKHSRPNLRCVSFSIYRRHPIKDVRCIRVAHSCSNPDSRLFIYGINMYDAANGESRFFPITSVVKNRGTQWALNTNFESRQDLNFSKMGCDCYDPFGSSPWPTYVETLVIIFYLWCAVLCFGHLIPVDAIWGKTALHALTVAFIAGSSAVVIAFGYLRFVKMYNTDQHSDTYNLLMIKSCLIFIVITLSLAFWALANGQTKACKTPSREWMISSVSSGIVLTLVTVLIYYLVRRRKLSMDNATLEECDMALMRTNSRPNIEFVVENSVPMVSGRPPTHAQQYHSSSTKKLPHQKANKTVGSSGGAKPAGGGKKGSQSKKKSANKQRADNKQEGNEETLENAFANSDGVYMKPRNRNSISQYV